MLYTIQPHTVDVDAAVDVDRCTCVYVCGYVCIHRIVSVYYVYMYANKCRYVHIVSLVSVSLKPRVRASGLLKKPAR